MRVFVFGTGCCGLLAFGKACQHIRNYTVEFNSEKPLSISDIVNKPTNHIEIDYRISWILEPLISSYATSNNKDKDIVLVHIVRDKHEVLDLWDMRAVGISNSLFGNSKNDTSAKSMLYDSIVNRCNYFLKTCSQHYNLLGLNIYPIIFRTYKSQTDFKNFWELIDARGSFTGGISEFSRAIKAKENEQSFKTKAIERREETNAFAFA